MSTASLHRDAYGVPHLRADSLLDLVGAQGRVTAHDRTWQLEWQRRRATGTTAELVGPSATGWDVLVRRVRLTATARRAHDALGAETRAVLAAYVDGVNGGLREDAVELLALGAAPAPWEPWTPVAVFAAQHLLFGSIGNRLWKRRLREVLGADAALISHEGLAASGSNAWAVGGDRTASGLPLIGGDPHRTIESPGVYLQVRLACEDPDDSFDVAGFTLAGLPGVQHFAHAGDVAWAITNAMADYQDLHDVDLADADLILDSYVEQVAVAGQEPVAVEVLVTERGPVIEGERGGPGLVLQQPSERLGDLGLDAIPALLRARTVADVDAALDGWVEPVNNVVTADVGGRVLYRLAGLVPTRDSDGRWTGWVDPLPRSEVDPDGEVVSANDRRGPESDAIGSGFAPPYRADRLRALLAGRDDLTAADFETFHNDTVARGLRPLVDLLLRAVPDDPALSGLGQWGLRMDADSVEAGLVARWRSALTRLISAQPALAALHEPSPHNPVHAPWLDATQRIGLALPGLIAAGTPFGIDLTALAREAWAEVGSSIDPWGATHVFGPVHVFDLVEGHEGPEAPAVGLDGDNDCVRCTGSAPGIVDTCLRGSVARYVWDLADLAGSGWIVPLGASGVPGDRHHLDQLPLWAVGRLAPIVTDWDRLTPDPA